MREQRYSTTTWAVWRAWQASDAGQPLELLKQALRIAIPAVLPVHLIEVFARSSARIGEGFDRSALLASPFWTQAESLLLCR